VELSAGIPGRALVDLALETGVDAVVLGTRGLSGFKHLLLGSTAEQVVRRARCPVLTVHPGDADVPSELRTLVVPTEISEDPAPALEAVVRLFPRRAARARVLLVYSDHLPSYLQPLLEDIGIDRVGFEEIADSLRERLRPTAERLAQAGFAVETIVREGEPASVITEVAVAESADLIAMETRGRSGLAHMVLGSTAERVVQHASCPVLTIHREPDTNA
jgi:nucleotide-binding universal stress UspA family protein